MTPYEDEVAAIVRLARRDYAIQKDEGVKYPDLERIVEGLVNVSRFKFSGDLLEDVMKEFDRQRKEREKALPVWKRPPRHVRPIR